MPVPAASRVSHHPETLGLECQHQKSTRINSRSTPTNIDPKQPQLPRSKSNPNRANTFKPRPDLPLDPRELCRRLDLVKIEGDVVKGRRKSLGGQLTPGSPSQPASFAIETLLAKSLEHHRSFDVDQVLQRRSGAAPSPAPGRLARPSSPQPSPPQKELSKRLETHSRADKDKSKRSTATSTAIAVTCMPPIPKTSAKNASSADPNPSSNPLRSPPSGYSKKIRPQLKTLANPSKNSSTNTPLTSPLPYTATSFTSTNIFDPAKVHPLSHQALTMYSNPLAPLPPRDRSAQQLTPGQLAQIRRRTLQTTDRLAARNQFSNSTKWTPKSRVPQNFMPNTYSYAPHLHPDTDFIDLSLHGPGSTVVPLARSASEGQKRKHRPRSTAFEQFSTARPSIVTGANVSPIPRSAQPYIDSSQLDEEISSEDRPSTGGNRPTVNFSLRRRLSREGATGNAAAQRASTGGQRSSRVLNGEGVGNRNSRALGGEFFAQRRSARYSKDGVTLTPGMTNVQRVEKQDSMEAKRRRPRREGEGGGGGGIEMGSSPVLPALSPFPPLTMPSQTNLDLAGVGRHGSIGQMAATPAGKQLSNDHLNGPMPGQPNNGHINAQQQQLNRPPSAGQLSGHSSRRTSGAGPGLTHAHTVSLRRSGEATHPTSPVHRRKSSGSAQIRLSNAHIVSQVDRQKSGGKLSIFPTPSPSPSPMLASASGTGAGAGGVGIGAGATGPTSADRASKRASRIAAQHAPIPLMLQGAGQSQSGTESETGTPTGMKRHSQGQMYPSVGVPPRQRLQGAGQSQSGTESETGTPTKMKRHSQGQMYPSVGVPPRQRPRRSSAASPLPVIPSHTELDPREWSRSPQQQQQQQRGRQPRHSLPARTSVPVPASPPRSKSRTSLHSFHSTKSIKSAKSTKSTKSTFSLGSTKSQRNTLQKRRKSDPRHVTQEQLDALAALTAPVPPPDGAMTEASLKFLEEQRRRLAEKKRRESLVSSRRGGGGGGGRDSSAEGSVRGGVGAGSVAGSGTSPGPGSGPGNNRTSGLARRPESVMSGTSVSVSVTEPFPVFKGKGKEKADDFSAPPSASVSVSEKQFGAGWERESIVLAKGENLTGLTPESVRLLREREKLVRWKAGREKAEFERKERERERVAAANEKWDAGEKEEKKKKKTGCLGGLWPF
ncbi:uncharacterized protein K441DRAFT_679278 [Cenococcum geophilum 1.58]|uniref:uncharacterized protein n=1 Tax=Cenococcum geophilum 1.58 TaxID=794803 RepID=UPI00358F68C7|nr:hypothetical protein K441DRAFT_679278 [Cenococcum geophilum 1.58]